MTEFIQTQRATPIEIEAGEFRKLGYQLIDDIADFMESLPQRRVAPGESSAEIRATLGSEQPLPEHGTDSDQLLKQAATLLFDHSTFNGHPRFLAYITSSAAPLGMLGDLLAASVNPNVGGGPLSPMATEIEAQTIRWIAEMLDYPTGCGGLFVSGGNAANFTAFVAARRAKTGWDVRTQGMIAGEGQRLRVYTSGETHTWIQKAADLFGLGTDSICWLPTDAGLRMDVAALRRQIEIDKANGDLPMMVIGTAGSTATGAVDPLPQIAEICREYNLWFHVDGAYGAPAAMLPDAPADLKALNKADSVAIDPHKWLYAPLEAGCVLVRDPKYLVDAFSYHPVYYHFENIDRPHLNYYEYSLQNSRGFRALKVWLTIQQVGRKGYEQMIAEDIQLAGAFYQLAGDHAELEAVTQGLSVVTFRYVPSGMETSTEPAQTYLNELNDKLLSQLNESGEFFLSNAVVQGRFLLRLCIVNFRTSLVDIQALPETIVRLGRALDAEMRPETLR